jgi:hypothetical protein
VRKHVTVIIENRRLHDLRCTLAGPEGDTAAQDAANGPALRASWRPCLTRKRSEAGEGGSQTLGNVKKGIQ